MIVLARGVQGEMNNTTRSNPFNKQKRAVGGGKDFATKRETRSRHVG